MCERGPPLPRKTKRMRGRTSRKRKRADRSRRPFRLAIVSELLLFCVFVSSVAGADDDLDLVARGRRETVGVGERGKGP